MSTGSINNIVSSFVQNTEEKSVMYVDNNQILTDINMLNNNDN